MSAPRYWWLDCICGTLHRVGSEPVEGNPIHEAGHWFCPVAKKPMNYTQADWKVLTEAEAQELVSRNLLQHPNTSSKDQ
jgi:hypothetical protein